MDERVRPYKPRIPYPITDGKRECRLCHEIKPIEMFSRDAKLPSGRSTVCKLCHADRARRSYAKRMSLLVAYQQAGNASEAQPTGVEETTPQQAENTMTGKHHASWTKADWSVLTECATSNELGPWSFDFMARTNRTMPALVAVLKQLSDANLTIENIRECINADIGPPFGITKFLPRVRAWLDASLAVSVATEHDEIPSPASPEEFRLWMENFLLGTYKDALSGAMRIAQLEEVAKKQDAHITALAEDIETLTNGLREWRKEVIAHYSVMKDKLVYQSGQMTALMRGFGVKVERSDVQHATPTVGD